MSLEELLPAVLSLSRSDKFRLIQCLANDLDQAEKPTSSRSNGVSIARVDDDDGPASIETLLADPNPLYPYWSPDRDAEAVAILMSLLKAEKSVS